MIVISTTWPILSCKGLAVGMKEHMHYRKCYPMQRTHTHTQDWITNQAMRAKSPRPPVFCKNLFTTFIISVDNVHGAYEFVINQSATLQSLTITGTEYCTHCTERLRNKWLIRANYFFGHNTNVS